MLHDLCPNGVEWKTLGEVFELRNGYTPSKANPAFWEGGTIPWFRMEDIREHGRILSDAIQHITPAAVKGKGLFEAGSFILATTATIGEHALLIADSLANQQFTNLKIRKSLEKTLQTKFVFHYMFVVDDFCKKHTNKSGFESVDMEALRNMPFPIPPLEVQVEIVNLLDKFTQLSAELKAELKLRRKQYDYYRNHLLSFDSNSTTVQWMPLGEVAEFTYGYTDKAKDEGDVRYIRITDIDKFGRLSPFDAKYISYTDNIKNYILQKDDIVMARTGATFGKTMIFLEDYPAVYASFLIKIHLNKSILLPKYYWHFAQSPLYWEQANKLVAGGAQPQFNTGAISQVRLPIPPITEQERIVGILDKFETLVNDLSKGLPAEIALVQKQYEYYRNLLLTFE